MSSRAEVGAVGLLPSFRVVARARAYIVLTKPRIIELLLVTTVPTMLVAKRSNLPSAWLILATVAGGMLAAGGANALNMVVDRDIDRLMQRTRSRPLVTGEIAPGAALGFAAVLEVLAFAELAVLVNVLSAVLAVSATAFYVGIYTLWLKRTSRQNIVIGGAAGAVPVLVGWSAVTGRLAVAPLVLFAVIFLWTPPHFWALAVRYRDDYQAAGVPMLPAVASLRTTAHSIVVYTALTVVASLVFAPIAHVGVIYTATAAVAGVAFLWRATALVREPTSRMAMKLFGFSITYLTVLFAAMAADQLVRKG
jgi:protoheme IX farnesyltransferase